MLLGSVSLGLRLPAISAKSGSPFFPPSMLAAPLELRMMLYERQFYENPQHQGRSKGTDRSAA